MKKYFKEIKRKSKKIQQNKCEDEKICDKRGKTVKTGRNEKKLQKYMKILEKIFQK